MSQPRENVLLVPFRKVLLSGSGWGGGKHRSSPHDAKGSGPFGGAQAGAEATAHATAGRRAVRVHGTARGAAIEKAERRRRQGHPSRAARAPIQSPAERERARGDRADSFARGVSGIWSDAGGGISGPEAQDRSRARGVAPDHAGGPVVARQQAPSGNGASVAGAQALARRDGAVGHLRARLVRGTECREAVSDPHDRRRHQRTHRALRGQRFQPRKSADAGELSTKPWAAGGVLYRQGQFVSNRSQDSAGPERVAAPGARAASSHADRQGLARVGHRLAGRAFSAGQRPRGAQFSDRAGPAGEGVARGRREVAGRGQPLSANRVSTVVESASASSSRQPHRCAPAAGPAARSGSVTQRSHAQASGQRLHHPFRGQGLPDRAPRHSPRLARRQRAHRVATGWNPPGALSTALSGRESVPLAATAQTRSRRRTQTATGARRLLGKQTATSRFPGCAGTIPAVEGRAHRPHPHYRHAGRMKLDRRAKPARRSSRFQMQSLRSGVPPAAHPIPNRQALRATSVAWEGLRRLLPEPTPSPQLCIDRKGATPFGLSHSNRPSHLGPSQPDISTWLTTGHFYLALTGAFRLYTSAVSVDMRVENAPPFK